MDWSKTAVRALCQILKLNYSILFTELLWDGCNYMQIVLCSVTYTVKGHHCNTVKLAADFCAQDLNAYKRQGLALLTKMGESVKYVTGGYKLRARPQDFAAMGEYLDVFTQKLGTIDRIAQRIIKEQSGEAASRLEQGCPTRFLEIYSPVGYHSNPNKAQLIQQLEQGCPTLFLEIYRPVGYHSNPNKAQLIHQLEQGCPTLFLEIYRPVGYHSNPNKAQHIQQLEQGCPTLFLEIYRPVGYHSNPNKAQHIQQLEQGCPTLFLEICRPVGYHSNPNKAQLIQQL